MKVSRAQIQSVSVPLLYIFSAIAVIGFFYGDLRLIDSAGTSLLASWLWKFSALGALGIGALFARFKNARAHLQTHLLSFYALLCTLCFLLFSDVPTRRFGFYHDGLTRLDLVILGAFFFMLLVFFVRRSGLDKVGTVFSPSLLLLLQVIVIGSFVSYCGGKIFWIDDHPSFLYRLHLLREHFPFIPFYNIDWNAGYSAREFFPSGILNVFLLTFPFVYGLGELSNYENAANYTYIIPYLYSFVVPWSLVVACRILGFNRRASIICGILALAPTISYFEWILKYGTLGFSLSAASLPLTIALSYRLAIDERRPKISHALSLLVVSFCSVSWTLSFLALIPFVVFALFKIKRVFARDRRYLVSFFILAFFVINLPWILIFFRESKVISFLSGSTLPGSHATQMHSPKRTTTADVDVGSGQGEIGQQELKPSKASLIRTRLQPAVVRVNPLILLAWVFAAGAVFLCVSRRGSDVEILFVATVVWLLIVAGVSDAYKPQLELKRMIIPSVFFMLPLAARAIYGAFLAFSRRGLNSNYGWAPRTPAILALIVLLGSLLLAPLMAAGAYANRSDEKFKFAPMLVKNLSEAAAIYGGDGRVFIAGFILHELGSSGYSAQDGGHVAPLPMFSGKHFYACDFYHTKWSSVDPIPNDYLARGQEGIEEFLDLVNATSVIAHSRPWRDYFEKTPGYKEVFQEDRFNLYTRKGAQAGYVMEGRALIKELPDGIEVFPQSERVVLKYKHHPRLTLSPSIAGTIKPRFVFDENLGGGKTQPVNFIELEITKEFVEKGQGVRIGF